MIIKCAASEASWNRYKDVLSTAKKNMSQEQWSAIEHNINSSLRPSQRTAAGLGVSAILGGKTERGIKAIQKSGLLSKLEEQVPNSGKHISRFLNRVKSFPIR